MKMSIDVMNWISLKNNQEIGNMGNDTKEKILLAAVREFAENGYHQTTVRKIVERAGAKNLNAVVYYYGGKEELYKSVLNFMFSEAEKFKDKESTQKFELLSVEEKLASTIHFLVKAYYSVDTQLDKDLYSIFIKEAMNPTPFLKEMVEYHLRPGKDFLCSLLKEYLGPKVPQKIIEDCEYSISAQILYGVLGWPIISRMSPDRQPYSNSIEDLSDHIVKFTLSGLKGFKNEYE